MWQNQLGKLFTSDLISSELDFQKAKQLLMEKIDFLIQNNFPELVQILYKMDISEKKLKSLLNEAPDIAPALIIANQLIARQIEKNKNFEFYTQQFSQKNSEEEKW